MTVSPVRLAAPRVFLKLHDLVVDVPVFVHRLGYEFLFKRLAVPIKPSLLQMPVVHVVVRLPGIRARILVPIVFVVVPTHDRLAVA